MLPLLASAIAAPAPVVAMGDGLVAGPPPAAASSAATVPGGWVPVLADCLEERAPKRFTVVDRSVPAETLASARAKVPSVRDLSPSWVVVALGAQELADPAFDPRTLREPLSALLGELRAKRVLLVGLVPPTLAQAEPPDLARQPGVDDRTVAANQVIAEVASVVGAVHVDPWTDWPRDSAARAALTTRGWTLSDQGHARVAAAVCDALLR